MRLSSAYLLAHNGLGDGVFMIGALHFLANFYDDVYFLCKSQYKSQFDVALKDWPFIHTVPLDASIDENNACKQVLLDKYQESDVFVCGFCHTHHLKSKISHPVLKDPSMLNRLYPSGFRTFMRECYRGVFPKVLGNYTWSHPGFYYLPDTFAFVDMFYRDLQLTPSIAFDFFLVSKDVCHVNDKLSNYRVAFVNDSCGMRDKVFDFTRQIEPWLKDDTSIVICSNKNWYEPSDPRYEVANRYVMKPTIFSYMDVLCRAETLWLSDSSIACLTIQLINQGKITTRDVHIVSRFTMQETDLSSFYI